MAMYVKINIQAILFKNVWLDWKHPTPNWILQGHRKFLQCSNTNIWQQESEDSSELSA